ncbi:unnamed protein product [Acanthoscelides obtectus]|uniref:Uncharacterized protein n=1 Tax=Acanthoscelides obtectus TaxID=200917 RepID=A0A9P0KAS0_ACAOB|nr:unnamed protein product [Acanthoscelides obtectus]CAK1655994.1 hypothetical protein AOBTE_LOCUS19496 [Acanthoscelides obtectus]
MVEISEQQSNEASSSSYTNIRELVPGSHQLGAEERKNNSFALQNNVLGKYKPTDLKKSCSTSLKQIHGLLNQTSVPSRSSRSRPATVVKTLTSFDIAAKYNQLLDIRLDLCKMTKLKLEQHVNKKNNYVS